MQHYWNKILIFCYKIKKSSINKSPIHNLRGQPFDIATVAWLDSSFQGLSVLLVSHYPHCGPLILCSCVESAIGSVYIVKFALDWQSYLCLLRRNDWQTDQLTCFLHGLDMNARLNRVIHLVVAYIYAHAALGR